MQYVKYCSILAAMALLMSGCSKTPAPVDGSNEAFSQKAIAIKYESAKLLNMHDGQPHVIPLVVYQVNNINSFNMLKKDQAGIIKLLNAQKFDKSVMSVSKYFIAPNETKEIFLDRASRTTWVALVAGYYEMQPEKSTLEYKIPDYTAWKFYESKEKQKFLMIDLYFDTSSMEQRQEQ